MLFSFVFCQTKERRENTDNQTEKDERERAMTAKRNDSEMETRETREKARERKQKMFLGLQNVSNITARIRQLIISVTHTIVVSMLSSMVCCNGLVQRSMLHETSERFQ